MNANAKRIGGQPVRARKAARGAKPQALSSLLRSDLHDAGLEAMSFFETMINPEDQPPERVPDAHSAMSAVFKTPFVKDLPFSGVWNPSLGRTSAINEDDPIDGYSEVILTPGTTACYFYTLGVRADIWAGPDTLDPAVGFNMLLIPILATHAVDTDIVAGRTQLIHGLRAFNCPGASDVCCLPKLDDQGHAIFEMLLQPLATVQDDPVEILLGFFNIGIESPSRTEAHFTFVWDSGLSVTLDMNVASTGDNNTVHSSFYIFQTTLPVANDFIVSYYVEVDDVDPASQWKFSMGADSNNGVAVSLFARSACSFAVVDAPEMNELSETLSERTTALTGLLTYMGSTLQDGGQISAARLGMGLSPLRSPAGDVYTYLASLPFYNDDYALREGIYAWWLPDSVQEHFYVAYRNPRSDDLRENAVLQFAVLRDNPNQAVRLKVVQNLETITRSRLYASKAGPNNPSYSAVIGAVKAIPAVTINKKHIGILGRAFSAVKGWVSKPANWKKLLKFGSSIIDRLAPV